MQKNLWNSNERSWRTMFFFLILDFWIQCGHRKMSCHWCCSWHWPAWVAFYHLRVPTWWHGPSSRDATAPWIGCSITTWFFGRSVVFWRITAWIEVIYPWSLAILMIWGYVSMLFVGGQFFYSRKLDFGQLLQTATSAGPRNGRSVKASAFRWHASCWTLLVWPWVGLKVCMRRVHEFGNEKARNK